MIRSAVGFSGATGWPASDSDTGALQGPAPAAEARGSLRAVLAALRNLEHLLRSPRVGPRALAQVVPGLRDLGALLSGSADEIREQLGPRLCEETAARELSEFLHDACTRLQQVLAWAAQAAMDAKSRLSFESQIGALAAELTTARRLLDMLSHAIERADTELDLGEVVQESLSVSGRRDGWRDRGVKVVADLPYGVHALQASVQVIVPLVTFGVAWVHGDQEAASSSQRPHPDDEDAEGRISIEAVRGGTDVVMIRVSRSPLEGDVHIVHLPVIIPPVLACAQASARIGRGSFVAERGRVTICWPAPDEREA